MKAQLEFKSGEVIQGRLSIWQSKDIDAYEYTFFYKEENLSFKSPKCPAYFETRRAGIEDFKRFGSIIGEPSD